VLPTAALADRYGEQQAAAARGRAEQEKQSLVASALGQRWVGRNEPCPCESAKRFKDCHGKL
jgi:preprotein translocase subunit SecA